MYLLNRKNEKPHQERMFYLHSTMYLLNPIAQEKLVMIYCYLHSTMYLLNLLHPVECMMIPIFTFHYVSIKSHRRALNHHRHIDLHSTMYLLNQYGSEGSSYISSYLHSTMYLLNQRCVRVIYSREYIYIPLCIY